MDSCGKTGKSKFNDQYLIKRSVHNKQLDKFVITSIKTQMISRNTLQNIEQLLKMNEKYFEMDKQQLEMRQKRILKQSLDQNSFDKMYKTDLKVNDRFIDLIESVKEQKQTIESSITHTKVKTTTSDHKQIGQKYESNNIILEQDYLSVNLFDKPTLQSSFQYNEFKKNKKSSIKHDNAKIRKLNHVNNQKIMFVGTFRLAEVVEKDKKTIRYRHFFIYDEQDIVGSNGQGLRKLVYDDDQDTDEELMFEHQQVVLKDLFSRVI